MKKVWQLLRDYPLAVLFALIILVLTVVDLATPDAKHSEMENRDLAQNPSFSWKSVFDLSYGQNYEKYINDQFILRDEWITAKSYAEQALGKTENNGILYGKDGFLFEKLNVMDAERVENNVGYLQKFAENCPYPLTIMMIPNSYMVYPDKLPWQTELLDQGALFERFYDQWSGSAACIDMLTPLRAAAADSDDLYYRTDHHWTTQGAYLAYRAFVESRGLSPVELASLPAVQAPDFYGTYFSKSKNFSIAPDTITYYPISDVEMTVWGYTEAGEQVHSVYDTLYNTDQFALRDKYAAFLYSNNDLTEIVNKAPSPEAAGRRLLVFKDSYGNSMIPFLTQNYESIAVVDIRYFTQKVSAYLAQNTFDDVLVMYNFSTFNTENIAKISY